MRIAALSCALLLFVACANAQDAVSESSTGGLGDIVKSISEIMERIGGLDGALTKLKSLMDLAQKAAHSEGITGTIARGLLRAEIEVIKKKVLNYQHQLTEKLQEIIEKRIGLRTYGGEDYIADELIRQAITGLRQKMNEILGQIEKAKNEADKTAGQAAEKAKQHIAELQKKLKQLATDLWNRLTGKNTEVAENYIADDFIREAVAQLRIKMNEILKKIAEAKTEAEGKIGDAKEIAKQHIKELQERLKNIIRDLTNKILGRTYGAVDDTVETYMETYIADELIRQLVGQFREKMHKVLDQIAEAKKKAESSVGEASKIARDHLQQLNEKLAVIAKNLMDTILGRRGNNEVETYIADDLIKGAIAQLRAKMNDILAKVAEAKREAESTFGDAKEKALEKARKLSELLSQLAKDLMNKILNRGGNKEVETYIGDDLIREVIAQIRIKMNDILSKVAAAKKEAESAAGEAKIRALEKVDQLTKSLKQLAKNLMDKIMGRNTDEATFYSDISELEGFQNRREYLQKMILDLEGLTQRRQLPVAIRNRLLKDLQTRRLELAYVERKIAELESQ